MSRIALMVKRIHFDKNDSLISHGDAVVGLRITEIGLVFRWGEEDGFLVSPEDMRMINDLTQSKCKKENPDEETNEVQGKSRGELCEL